MATETIIVLSVILSYFGVGFVFRKKSMSYLLGLEYLIIGFGFSFLHSDRSVFYPLLPPFLGVFGLLTGLQFRFNDIKMLGKDFWIKVSKYVFVVSIFLIFVFSKFFTFSQAGIFALIFSLTSYKIIATFIPDKKKKDREMLFFAAFIPFIVLAFYFIFTFLDFAVKLFAFFIVFTVVFSLIAKLIISNIEEDGTLVVAVIGFVLFFSEIAYIIGFSPLVSMYFVGLFLANYCKRGDDVFKILLSDEKQLYTMFLIFLGFLSGFVFSWYIFKVVLIIVVAVAFIKYVFFFFGKENFWLYLSPGAFGVVLMADYWLLSGHEFKSVLFTGGIISILFFQLLSMIILKRVIKDV